jgi:hypothetical protein
MERWPITVALLLCSVVVRSQACQTIAAGALLDVNNWLCDCNILECDTIRINHAMNVDDTVALANAVYTNISSSGSLSGDGVVSIAGNLVNHGTIAVNRLATDVDWIPEYDTYFTNHGIITSSRLVLFADSTRNFGYMIGMDSLVIGTFRRLYNDASIESRIIYGLGGIANTGHVECDSIISGRAFYNDGTLSSAYLFELYSNSINSGTIWADEYNHYSGSFYNEGSISINGTTSLGVYGGIQFEQTPGARITTRNLYVLENTDIRGLGSVCILEHAENHGNLIGSMQLCDLTPTMTTPPFWDVHTGTIVLNPTYCGPLACATVDVAELAGSAAPKLFPNPTAGTVHVEWSPRAEVVHEWTLLDALGQRMMHSNAAVQEHLVLDLSTYAQGTYWLVLQDAHGAVLQRVPVMVAR